MSAMSKFEGLRWWQAAPLLVAGAAVVAMPFAAMRTGDAPESHSGEFHPIMANKAPAFDDAPTITQRYDPQTSQLTYLNLRSGEHKGTANERFSRPSLSLSKLYIAQYVFEHGDDEQQELAKQMVETSDDAIADELFDAFPDSIDAIAEQYDLESTAQNGQRWGYSVTSTYDVVYFLLQLLREDPDSPVIQAMAEYAPKAADGTEQNFGTATLPGATANKFGWASDGSLHSSVSIGKDYIVAAAVFGSEEDLSEFVQRHLDQSAPSTSAQPAN